MKKKAKVINDIKNLLESESGYKIDIFNENNSEAQANFQHLLRRDPLLYRE